MKKTQTFYLARVLAVLCSCLMSLPVLAQNKGGGKGGGGGGGADGGGSTGPAGDVYFQSVDVWAGRRYEISNIKADGSGGASVVYDNPDGQGFREASHQLHGGQRWFLSTGNWWPDTDWGENNISATSESGVTVPLFVSGSDFEFIQGGLHWIRPASDNWVSFAGTQWETDPETGQQTLVNEGIFRVKVQFADDGTIVGGVPGSFELVISTLPFAAQPSGHDWGSDGQLLFVTRVQNPDGGSSTQLWMADVSVPTNDPLILPVSTGSNQPIWSPSWSPDGSKVAFSEYTTGIVILTLSNGSRRTIKSNATTGVGGLSWSPTGEWIVYERTRSQDRITKI